jgi:hypothetical protein
MALAPLPPIVAAAIADDRLLYSWDEWNVRDHYDFPDDALFKRLDGAVSGRGAIALTIAAGEWVCERFSKVNADSTPLQYLEAAWAGQVDSAYCEYTETDDDEWRGVVRAPLAMVITIANDALFCLDEDPVAASRAVWMTNLARHLLPSRDAFESWLDAVLVRLAQHHPPPPDDPDADEDPFASAVSLGHPVARELFDTTRPFDKADEDRLINAFLQRLDPSRNPFLHPVAWVADTEEFSGTPYQYP